MRAFEIFENTTSGAIATAVMPIGTMIKRSPDNQKSGKYKNSVKPLAKVQETACLPKI